MSLNSKEWVILIIEGTIGVVIALIMQKFSLLSKIELENFWTLYIISIALFLVLLIFLLITQKRINENIDDIEINKKDLIELNKRFKTIEELNDIKLDIKELKREVFNGKKK